MASLSPVGQSFRSEDRPGVARGAGSSSQRQSSRRGGTVPDDACATSLLGRCETRPRTRREVPGKSMRGTCPRTRPGGMGQTGCRSARKEPGAAQRCNGWPCNDQPGTGLPPARKRINAPVALRATSVTEGCDVFEGWLTPKRLRGRPRPTQRTRGSQPAWAAQAVPKHLSTATAVDASEGRARWVALTIASSTPEPTDSVASARQSRVARSSCAPEGNRA